MNVIIRGSFSLLNKMPLDTLCHSCKSQVQVIPGDIFTCQSCNASQVAIAGWGIEPGYKLCPLFRNHIGSISYGAVLSAKEKQSLVSSGIRFLASPADFPIFVDATVLKQHSDPCVCFDGCAWGADYYHLNSLSGATPGDFYLIFPVYRTTKTTVLYHGTTIECALGIKATNKLLPPSVTGRKTQGLNSEKDIRYVGIDRTSAIHHDRGAIIELEYIGWVLRTHLGLLTGPLHKLHDRLPQDVPAVEFFEAGRAIAFRKDADVTIKHNKENEELWASITPPPSRREKLIAKLQCLLQSAMQALSASIVKFKRLFGL